MDFPLGTPLAAVILDFIPQRQLGPVRLTCKGLLDSTQELTFACHPARPGPGDGARGKGKEQQSMGKWHGLMAVDGVRLTLPRYCTLFPSAAKVVVGLKRLREDDAVLLRRFSDITIVGQRDRRCDLTEAVLVAIAERGPAHPPLRRLVLQDCDGPTGAAFGSMPHLQDLTVVYVPTLCPGALRLPPSLTRFRCKLDDGWHSREIEEKEEKEEVKGKGSSAADEDEDEDGQDGEGGEEVAYVVPPPPPRWSLSLLSACPNLRHLDLDLHKVSLHVDPAANVDLAASCPALETIKLKLRLPAPPSPEATLVHLPAISWANLPRLRYLHLGLDGGSIRDDTAVLDSWLEGLRACAQLQYVKLVLGVIIGLTSLPLPPSVVTLAVHGDEIKLSSPAFLSLPRLRKLDWESTWGTDADVDLAEACPGLEVVRLRMDWHGRAVGRSDSEDNTHDLTHIALPRVSWGKLARLREVNVDMRISGSDRQQAAGQAFKGWLSGLPACLQVLRVAGNGSILPVPLLTYEDIADLPGLRELHMESVEGFTGAKPAALPALETLKIDDAPECFTSFKFVSGCSRLREVELYSCDLGPDALAELPPCVQGIRFNAMNPPSTAFRSLPGLRKLFWYTGMDGGGMDGKVDLAEACPLLEEVSMHVYMGARKGRSFEGLPRITWAKLTGLRVLNVSVGLARSPRGHVNEKVRKATVVASAGWLSGLPKSLQRLSVACTNKGAVLRDEDIADLPSLRELHVDSLPSVTGLKPAALPALERLSVGTPSDEETPCLRSLAFLSACSRLRNVRLQYCPHVKPEALAALPASVEWLTLEACGFSAAQARAACTHPLTVHALRAERGGARGRPPRSDPDSDDSEVSGED